MEVSGQLDVLTAFIPHNTSVGCIAAEHNRTPTSPILSEISNTTASLLFLVRFSSFLSLPSSFLILLDYRFLSFSFMREAFEPFASP